MRDTREKFLATSMLEIQFSALAIIVRDKLLLQIAWQLCLFNPRTHLSIFLVSNATLGYNR